MQLEDVNKVLTVFTDWLDNIEQNIERDREEGPFSDLSEKKTACDKFKLISIDITQHSEMVSTYVFLQYFGYRHVTFF